MAGGLLQGAQDNEGEVFLYLQEKENEIVGSILGWGPEAVQNGFKSDHFGQFLGRATETIQNGSKSTHFGQFWTWGPETVQNGSKSIQFG